MAEPTRYSTLGPSSLGSFFAGTQRVFSFMRFLYRGLPSLLVFLWLSAQVNSPDKMKFGEIAMTDRSVTDMDEGSKGGRRSALVFGVVAATLTALLIVIGVAGKNAAPNTPQSNTESPATSSSQNPY